MGRRACQLSSLGFEFAIIRASSDKGGVGMTKMASDIETADAFWTLLKPQKREVRELLASRLDESLKEEGAKKTIAPSAEALDFVRALSLHGGMKVPPDEKGILALLDKKY